MRASVAGNRKHEHGQLPREYSTLQTPVPTSSSSFHRRVPPVIEPPGSTLESVSLDSEGTHFSDSGISKE
ncbi:hypothetical protein M413DRAFT_443130 [Hebeloma cylindrosporum]|uniref:Uncharacterized protein n=1 Tax=Hebeloma cylindrosporum TaxID=76867 RepID=A0A0C3CJY8_HEBCY|nr:hypothetical protein M413DRAFT_443130 [Hebeloma cylindrosporum h7]